MIHKTLYVCELCKTEYNSELSAMNCEKHHINPKSVKALRFNAMNDDSCPAPIMVTVRMCNGEEYVYRRCHKGDAE